MLNATFLGAWWVLTDNPYKPWALTFTLVALFFGAFLLVQERATEITVKGVGTIKAAAESAREDAQAIANLKERIEAQSATIDLVASRATEAQRLGERLRRIVDFSTTVIAAQNDDRAAFDRLGAFIDERSELSRLAAHAQITIRSEAGGPVEAGYLNLPEGHQLVSAAAADLREIYAQLPSVYRASAVNVIWNRNDLSVGGRMRFLVNVLRDDPSLTATLYAGKFFAKQAGLKWQPFSVGPLLDWWEANKATFEKDAAQPGAAADAEQPS